MASPSSASGAGDEPMDLTALLDGLSDKQLAAIREAFASFASDGSLLKAGERRRYWMDGGGA